MMTKDQLLNELSELLQDLYDPNRLRTTPLADLLNVAGAGGSDKAAALRNELLAAIEALKPMPHTSTQSRAWRIYDILFYSYVQQFSNQEVADQIGLSTRHLRREKHMALNALVDYLWQHFNLEQRVDVQPPDMQTTANQPRNASAALESELSWVKELPSKEPVDLNQVLSSVVELTRNLVDHYHISLHVELSDSLPNLAVHPTALRQVLLSLLTIAIHRSVDGRVDLLVQSSPTETTFQLEGVAGESHVPTLATELTNEDDTSGLEIVHSLVDILGGSLSLPTKRSGFEATMTLPALACLPVLVIDDNMDILQLLQRYASGSRYRIVGTQDPRGVLPLAEEISPQIIVMDVMMPEVDGWELLVSLRQHPLTAYIPIIICTILPQRELALSVGADGFVQKPVSRASFLAVLDQQMAQGKLRGKMLDERADKARDQKKSG